MTVAEAILFKSLFILNKKMAKETIKSKLEDFVTHSTELGETAYKLARINAVRKTTNISANLIFSIIASILIIFSLLFVSAAAAWWLGDLLNSRAIGFLVVAGFYILLLIFVLLLKGSSILPYFRNKIVRKIYE